MFSTLEVITYTILQPITHEIETQETIEKIETAKNLIEYRISDLEVKVSDYAFWDDTYEFIQNRNKQFLLNNFVDSTFENLQLNCILIVNNETDLMYQQAYDLDASVKYDITEEKQEFFTNCPHIWNFQHTNDVISGLMLVENQPMIIATAPILHSNKEGPIIGGILFGKTLDYEELNRLNNIVNYNFTLSPASDFEMKEQDIFSNLLLNRQSNALKEENQTVIAGYTLIEDVHSNPSIILTIYNERTIYQQSIFD